MNMKLVALYLREDQIAKVKARGGRFAETVREALDRLFGNKEPFRETWVGIEATQPLKASRRSRR